MIDDKINFDLIGLLDSYRTICFYGGGAKVTQQNGMIQQCLGLCGNHQKMIFGVMFFSSFGARSYFEGGNNNNGRPNNGPGFDDHGRGFYDMADQNGQPNGGGPGEQSGPYRK